MDPQYPLFSEVTLIEDMPKYGLKRGDTATIVEYYPAANGQEAGYSLEGFNVPSVTVEVGASQIIPANQWLQEVEILSKLRQLSSARLLQLEEYLDFLVHKEIAERKSA